MVQLVKSIFVIRSEGRLRTPWRLALFALLLVFFALLAQLPLAWLSEIPLEQMSNRAAVETSRGLDGVASTLSITLAVLVAGRLLDRRRFIDFGLGLGRDWWIDFGFGLALGALLMGGIFGAELALGWVTVTDLWHSAGGLPFAVAILVPLLAFIFVGYYEELLVRGYLLRNLAEGLGFRAIGSRWALLLAWLLTSALFGFLHAGNPNASFISSFNIGLAGLLLGLGILLTGELAIPIGLHITWNFFQGNVFGFPVSGLRVSEATVVAIRQSGPEQWTGGAFGPEFGPEAGLIGLLAIAIGCGLTLLWVRWRTGRLGLHTPFAHYRPLQEQIGTDEKGET